MTTPTLSQTIVAKSTPSRMSTTLTAIPTLCLVDQRA
jgi:hypothetical protein